MEINLISNRKRTNHLKLISDIVKSADEIWIATAFLKISGLKEILPSLKKAVSAGASINIIAGQHFALTEPEALFTLKKLFDNNTSANLYLAYANRKDEVFHPKIYLCRKNRTFTLITGSSNITGGGLSNNIEVSSEIKANVNDKIWKETLQFFNYLISDEVSEEATLLAIKRYKSFYDKQKVHNNNSKAVPERLPTHLPFNYKNLLEQLKKYAPSNRDEDYKWKMKAYKEARKVLNEIADNDKLSKKEFSELLDSLVGRAGHESLWHSGSLYRLRKKVYKHPKRFQNLVRFIRDNSKKSPSFVFEKAKKLVSQINGAGINYITEIMMTYRPDKFANLNRNPIKVLREKGDVSIKATSNSFNGIDYEEYCELVKEINKKLELRNMLEADSFFNEIYWRIYK